MLSISGSCQQIHTEMLMGECAPFIAIVDDDCRVVESLINLLASCQFTANGYRSAEEFLTSGARDRCRCLITDIGMRQVSGLDLLRQVKQEDSTLPVIVITGRPYENSEAVCRGKGADGFFCKPVDGNALITLLHSMLR